MINPKFTPGPHVALIEDHAMCDTGDVYTEFLVVAEKNGKNGRSFYAP